MKFWLIQHSRNTEDWGMYKVCYERKYAAMQYEYGIQSSNSSISERWNRFTEVNEGDVLFLQNGDHIYAWGQAIKPRKKNKNNQDITPITLSARSIINSKNHGEYRSDKSKDYIVFEDCDVFYENLEDGYNNWGQRIDVDDWKNWKEKGVLYNDKVSGRGVAKQISHSMAQNYIRQLSGNPNFEFSEVKMNELLNKYTTILEKQKNIVLTGAPGTGKTYLAKQIAEELIKADRVTPVELLLKKLKTYTQDEINDYEDETTKLLQEFSQKFPKGTLNTLSLNDYCIGNGKNNSFCWYLERGLEKIGRLSPGSSSTYGVYWNKQDEDYRMDTRRFKETEYPTAKRLMKDIAESLYELVTSKSTKNMKLLNFSENVSLKVLQSYYPDDYFPVYSRERLFNICRLFSIPIIEDMLGTNQNINQFFKKHPSFNKYSIQLITLALWETFDLSTSEINMPEADKIDLKGKWQLTQFHPSYDYTDFVEGLRPIQEKDSKEISFQLKEGCFKEFCTNAVKNPSIKFVFIIDEINRGEISKILGELFYSIDPGYRGKEGEVTLQYSNLYTDEEAPFYNGFYIPENVYIIGTMNDIDRSVEPFDFAMRRRFSWYEIKPTDTYSSMWKDKKWQEEAFQRMNNLNQLISESLSDAYQIGPAYFLKLDAYEGDFNKIWEHHLEPLLKEYFKGINDEKALVEKMREAYNLQDIDDNIEG